MTLQNRVLPDGKIVAENWRGTMMGNRGGRIHDPETKTLLNRKWASKRWIICVTEFKNRQRKVMGNSYTELFFLDDVSALASGHRPCFECRRQDANAFSQAWIEACGRPNGSLADGMDKILQSERTAANIEISNAEAQNLPDGGMVECGGEFFARKGSGFLKWTGKGYQTTEPHADTFTLLTPPSIIKVLKHGYQPVWHPSAN